ncbi:MAG: hypothetical protein ACRCZ0_09400 [Cetobacterium sp.]
MEDLIIYSASFFVNSIIFAMDLLDWSEKDNSLKNVFISGVGVVINLFMLLETVEVFNIIK